MVKRAPSVGGNIFNIFGDKVPNDTVECLEALYEHAKAGRVTGFAGVLTVVEGGFMPVVAGRLHEEPELALQILPALRRKLAERGGGGSTSE